MKNSPTPRYYTRSHESGFTLVELLVAMVVSLLILTAAGTVFIVARQGFQTNDDRTRTLETGRLVLDMLTRNIRMAGAPSPDLNQADFETWNLPGLAESFSGTEGGANPDSITVSYMSDRAYNAARLGGADCLGQAVGLGMVTNRFSISGDGQLQCLGNGVPGGGGFAGVQPLAGPVVDMQITYALLDPTTADMSKRFKQAEDLNVAVVNADSISAGSWEFVRAVNICLDVASFEPNTLERDPSGTLGISPGLNCRGVAFAADGRVHRIFRTTVNVRNSTFGDNRL